MNSQVSAGPVPVKMKAVQVDGFGGIAALQYRDVDVPQPGPAQVLVRVHAAGVGPWDAWIRSGNSVLEQPLPLTPGSDISGVVVALGSDVKGLAAGDEIYGVTNPRFTNGYAEYALADAAMIARKPASLSHAEAASVPVIAVTAWQMLFDHGGLQKGQTVVIHGAAGNVGGFAVQLAAKAGAHVIAAASQKDADYVRGLGAKDVVESRTGSFADWTGKVDLVLDLVGEPALDKSYALMKPDGIIVSAVTQPDKERAAQHKIKADFMLVAVNTEVLDKLADLLTAGKLHTRVGDVLPLSDARIAHEMLDGRAHKPGKIVLEPGR
jgi:NADPH:quinone reductase-like Zn-dependent oxidoreductase